MAQNKFILVSLKDDEAKKLAQVITNDTSRKILDLLAESEATETEISKSLAVPLPTVHYNLKALTQAGLVVADQFHYSAKGREVNHYRLANKYIIIAPQNTVGLREKLRSILPIVPIIGGASLALEWMARSGTKVSSTISSVNNGHGGGAPLIVKTTESGALKAASAIAEYSTPFASRTASAAMGSAPSMAQEAAPALKSIAADQAISSASQKVSEIAIQNASLASTPISESTVQTITLTQSPNWIMSHPGLWLAVGALIAITIWLIVEYIRNKKQNN